jgi:hypothetical protein
MQKRRRAKPTKEKENPNNFSQCIANTCAKIAWKQVFCRVNSVTLNPKRKRNPSPSLYNSRHQSQLALIKAKRAPPLKTKNP